jgi:hypothetical protein
VPLQRQRLHLDMGDHRPVDYNLAESETLIMVRALSWLDDFLYLPEVLYVLFFILLICSGPGRFSVDYWLAVSLRR